MNGRVSRGIALPTCLPACLPVVQVTSDGEVDVPVVRLKVDTCAFDALQLTLLVVPGQRSTRTTGILRNIRYPSANTDKIDLHPLPPPLFPGTCTRSPGLGP
ncbi:unnamed protein product [Tuber aestivum]|uniref:Uncharacterized protein n=1 Tax=Tuber aestivum TaxID=59557 RepID=A0A292Q1N5_9PEZI|nr:unnamed protein product [Tuber aestivum]